MLTLQGILQLHNHSPIILHRDLKSPNLLVDKHWRVKVGDFNLSRVMEGSAVLSSITANNPRWLAPEVRSARSAGHLILPGFPRCFVLVASLPLACCLVHVQSCVPPLSIGAAVWTRMSRALVGGGSPQLLLGNNKLQLITVVSSIMLQSSSSQPALCYQLCPQFAGTLL